MNRKETTAFLSNLLERDRLSGSMGKYWAKEVSIDYGTSNVISRNRLIISDS